MSSLITNLDQTQQSRPSFPRKQSQHSVYARTALMSRGSTAGIDSIINSRGNQDRLKIPDSSHDSLAPPAETNKANSANGHGTPDQNQDGTLKPGRAMAQALSKSGMGASLSDTPAATAPNSPKMSGTRQGPSSGASTPRIRPTTLDIPGLTKSKVSPDGRISQRDIGSKLVIVMVGLPARGKSYITKKMARYLNWLQHDTRIFNVGERRRMAAGGGQSRPQNGEPLSEAHIAARVLINGEVPPEPLPHLELPEAAHLDDIVGDNHTKGAYSDAANPPMQNPGNTTPSNVPGLPPTEAMDQSATFFDPNNKKASQIREQVALETLNELLNYILVQGGAVGILDATNSTLQRRKIIMRHIRERAGPEVNVLFIESLCQDQNLLESNMRLKLAGPDYKDKDPVEALADFKKRVAIYEKNYQPIGDYEEKNNMPYVQMIDVGRKVISHQIKGFLSAQAVYYLLNFNLAPRQIWITRHGESMDNVSGKIGGDSDLSENGRQYARALAKFVDYKRKEWNLKQEEKARNTHFPPHPGDHTPPNPYWNQDEPQKSFCVWTSMLKRSIQSADYFDEEEYDIKQMRMLNELYSGDYEGMTYKEIEAKHPEEYALRKKDKLHYRYPGAGGEGYLDVINRLRPVIVELERMTDHALLLTHRSVARVLLAYFKGLRRDEVADVDVPLGMLYSLEPKPYGVEFNAYQYNPEEDSFDYLPNFQLRRADAGPDAAV